MQQSTSSVLAAYATIKSLSDEKKYQSPYQILREFLRYIIKEDALYSFSSAEMKNHLSDHFGFSIPEAVIRTSNRLKQILRKQSLKKMLPSLRRKESSNRKMKKIPSSAGNSKSISVLMMKTLSYAANLKSIVAETKKPLRKKSAEKTNGNYLGISSGEFPF